MPVWSSFCIASVIPVVQNPGIIILPSGLMKKVNIFIRVALSDECRHWISSYITSDEGDQNEEETGPIV